MEIAGELSVGTISDVWFAIFPVLWLDVAIVVLFLLSWGLLSARLRPPRSPRTLAGWRRWIIPDFQAIRGALDSAKLRTWILGVATAYAILLMILQRTVVVDPGGALAPEGASYPFVEVFGGPMGWGPKLVLVPNPYFGVLLRPYTVAATILLSVLAGFGMGLMGYRRRAARGAPGSVRRAAAAAGGLLVMCPVCAGSPVLALLSGLLTPAAAAGGVASSGLLVGPLMAFSTAMLGVSTLMMWMGIARASHGLERIEASSPAPVRSAEERRRRLGSWLLVVAVVLAVGSLLIDLSGASAGGSHAGHGGEAPPAHPPIALGLFLFGLIIFLTGAPLVLPGYSASRRQLALLTALALLYADGVVHWLAVSEHIGSGPNVAFFLAAGGIQVLSAPIALRRDRLLWWAGLPFTAFLILMYAVTRVAVLPLELGLEPIEQLGLVSKGIEVSLLVALTAYFGRRIVPAGLRELASRHAELLLLAIGLVVTGAAILMEATWGLLPSLAVVVYTIVLAALIVVALLVHFRRARHLVLPMWALATLLFIGHVAYAVNYAGVLLVAPILLCLLSASTLGGALIQGVRNLGRVRLRPSP